MRSEVECSPKSGRQSLCYLDLPTPDSPKNSSAQFTTAGQTASVSELWRHNLAYTDLPPPTVFTLEDQADFSPKSGISKHHMPLYLKSDPGTPLQSSGMEFSSSKRKSYVSPLYALLMGKNKNQKTPGWPPTGSGGSGENNDKRKGSSMDGVVQPDALITVPPPREFPRPEAQRNLDIGRLNEGRVTVDWFYPAETNLECSFLAKQVVEHTPIKVKDIFLGTTLCALKYNGGVLLAADSRSVNAADGSVVYDNKLKIYELNKRTCLALAGSVVKGFEFRKSLENRLAKDATWESAPILYAANVAVEVLKEMEGESGVVAAIMIGLDTDKSTKVYNIRLNEQPKDVTYAVEGHAGHLVEEHFNQNGVGTRILTEDDAKDLLFGGLFEAERWSWATGGFMNFLFLRTNGEPKRETAIPPSSMVNPALTSYTWRENLFSLPKLSHYLELIER